MDPLTLRKRLNQLNGSTALGLAVARLGGADVRPGPRGLWLAEGYRLRFPVAGAFTVGNVVITPETVRTLCDQIPGTLEHEDRHASQWAWCFGLPFLPAYVASMAWSWVRTGDRAAACWFEQEAGLASGGYSETPRRRALRLRWRDSRCRRRRLTSNGSAASASGVSMRWFSNW